MEKKKLYSTRFMQIPIYLLVAATVLGEIPWLSILAAVSMIGCSIYAMIEAHRKGLHRLNYVINILLILVSIYIIAT